jgi:predicted nucleotidyltransferase
VTAQQQLVDRVRDDLLTDDRVRGLWLTGSLATGEDDSFSDVDMFVVVSEDVLADYLDGWPSFAEAYSPLLARRLGPAPVFNHVLHGWLRWDVVVGTPAEVGNLDRTQVSEVFNLDGLAPSSPSHRGADPAVVQELTEEFLRVLGLLPVVLGRNELVTAVSGAGILRQLLTTLLRYRAEGDRLSGALHLNRVLPADEVTALAALPPVYADRGAVVRLHLACAAMFLPVARELLGDGYPFDLEAACWSHLRAHLGTDVPPQEA